LIEYAEKHGIEIAKDKRGEAPFSVDANLLHTSSEGKALEDPAEEAPEFVYQRTVSPEAAPDKATYIEVGFERGDAVSINGVAMSPATLLTRLNELGGENGIGRLAAQLLLAVHHLSRFIHKNTSPLKKMMFTTKQMRAGLSKSMPYVFASSKRVIVRLVKIARPKDYRACH